MSIDTLTDVNWPAAVVAGLAFFFLGAIWYAQPIFGRIWDRVSGLQTPEGGRWGTAYYLVPLLTCLLSAVATAVLAAATDTDTLPEALLLGLVVGIGYSAAVALVGGIFDPHRSEPKVWFAIFAGYQVTGLVVVAVIVALWT